MTRYKFVRHSDMCGCERCAARWDMMENPTPAMDRVEMTQQEIEDEDYDNSLWERDS